MNKSFEEARQFLAVPSGVQIAGLVSPGELQLEVVVPSSSADGDT